MASISGGRLIALSPKGDGEMHGVEIVKAISWIKAADHACRPNIRIDKTARLR
jgi:hypothetical protein